MRHIDRRECRGSTAYVLLGIVAVAAGCSTGEREPSAEPPPTLRVLTLNIAHGRKQALQVTAIERSQAEKNLTAIAVALDREQPHLVALQEADGPCFWSGAFDHVAYLAKQAGYPHTFRGEHVRGWNLSYGTALLSTLPIQDPASVRFVTSPPTQSKGFVVAAVDFPARCGRRVTVVSVHLDFTVSLTRKGQIKELITYLRRWKTPYIIMGDFNCAWTNYEPTLHLLAKELDVRSYDPEDGTIVTYPSISKRLDWIFISRELEFVEYRTLPDMLSDHHAVLARIRFRD